MSTELTLLPYDEDFASHTVLQVIQDYDLFDQIDLLPNMEVDDKFYSFLGQDEDYDGDHYGKTTVNPCGERVVFVLAKDLKSVNIPEATGAYIRELPDRTKVALFWQ